MTTTSPDDNTSVPSRPVKATPEQLREATKAHLRQYATDAKYHDEYEACNRITDRILTEFATFLASIELPEKNNREQIKCPEWCGLCVQNGRRYNDDQSQAIIDNVIKELRNG